MGEISNMIGEKIPQFVLKDENGDDFSSDNLIGKYTVIYFYPKANTPGCTLEGLDFSFLIDEFGGNVIGISPDSCNAISKFKSSKGLNVKLLSDPDKKIASAFGVVEDGKLVRSTFIVDKEGKVRRVWKKVKVTNHAKEVLEEYKKIIEHDK